MELEKEWFCNESREEIGKQYDMGEKCKDALIRETYQMLSDIDSVLGIRKMKAKEKSVKKCVDAFEMEMIGRYIELGDEMIHVHISEVVHLKHQIDTILSDSDD